MKTIATILALMVTITFVGCGSSTTETETAEKIDTTVAKTVDTNFVPSVAADTTKK